MKNRKTTIISSIVLIIGMLFAFTHCGVPSSSLRSTGFEDGASYHSDSVTEIINDEVLEDTEEGQLTIQTVDIGVKSFEQVLVSMSQVTGVDYKSSRIQNVYEDVESQLPTSNSIKSFSASNRVAIMKLASEFCNEVKNSTTLRSNLWPSTNFGANTSTAYSAVNRDVFINESLENFYPHITQDDQEYMEYYEEANSLILDLLADTTNNSTGTRNIAFAVCTTLLSSLEMTAI